MIEKRGRFMSQDKISVVTRAYNRLEYTMRTINKVIENTKYDNYEHIIMNNKSQDGTAEWLNWIKNTKQPHFAKVKGVNLDKNYGDWGGMVLSLKHISPDSKYIVQLDNDIIVSENWLNYMKFALEKSPARIVMLKRTGVGAQLKPHKKSILQYDKDTKLHIGMIRRVVACYMLKTEDFTRATQTVGLKAGRQNKQLMCNIIKPQAKILNVYAHHGDEYKYQRQTTWEKY